MVTGIKTSSKRYMQTSTDFENAAGTFITPVSNHV